MISRRSSLKVLIKSFQAERIVIIVIIKCCFLIVQMFYYIFSPEKSLQSFHHCAQCILCFLQYIQCFCLNQLMRPVNVYINLTFIKTLEGFINDLYIDMHLIISHVYKTTLIFYCSEVPWKYERIFKRR